MGCREQSRLIMGQNFAPLHSTSGRERNELKLDFSRPGKPIDNAYIESFNGRLREECLNQHWFAALDEARREVTRWREEYNLERPHSGLGDRTPSEFMAQWKTAQVALQ